jgi:hypothetical protein
MVMNKIFTILVLIVSLTSVGYCQEIFRVEDANCSFEIPESWELVAEDGDLKNGTIIEHFFIDENITTRNTSFRSGHKYNIYLSTEVNPKIIDKKAEARRISISTEPKKQEVLDKSFEFLLKQMKRQPGNWDKAKLANADCYYNVDTHAFFKTLVLNKADVGYFIKFHAIFLGNSRETVFKFLWEGNNPDAFLDYAHSIVDSFSYDDGYGFGEGSDGITLDLETVSKNQYFWLLPSIGFIVVIFLIRKWASS